MNRTKIEWTDYSWNPITGCKHGCWYCYAERLTKRFPKIFPYGFEPHFYPERLKEPWELKKPSKIFVCSIADLFAPWTPRKWMFTVLESMRDCPVEHTFQMLTKCPKGINKLFDYPDNWWFGVTVTQQSEVDKIDELREVNAKVRFVSFEPLLGYVQPDLNGVQWVIVGKLTGSRRVKLDMGWVMDISAQCSRLRIPIFLKNNLGLKNPRQEFPEVQP